KAFAPRAPTLVDADNRLLGQVMLGADPLHHAGHLVGAAASSGRADDFDGLGGLPRMAGHRPRGDAKTGGSKGYGFARRSHCNSSLSTPVRPIFVGSNPLSSLHRIQIKSKHK